MASDLPKTSWKRETPFRLGGLEILPASCEVRGRRGLDRLRPLLMDILLRLAAQPGEVVRRETLLEDVWPRRMVNDEVLSRAIAELRTALGDDARVARYIETLPKLGYRLVAVVEEIVPGARSTPATGPAPPPEPAPIIVPAPPRPATPLWPMAALAAVVILLAGGWWLMHRTPPPAPLANVEEMLARARPFTSDPGLELAPRFSPDGQRVAFALAEGNESRIVVQSVDGSAREFIGGLTGLTRLSPVFLPDGRHIAYWKADEQDCAIVEHDLDTGLERKLLDCALSPRSRFDISRDGRWLVFSASSRKDFPSALWILEIDHGTPVALTAPEPGTGEDLFPRFSPDGRRVAFFRGSESHRVPWIATRGEPSSERALAKVEGLSYGLAWRGDDTLVAAADWFGFRALNAIDVASAQARLLGARGARFPDSGPHGELVYENAMYSANLWLLDPARRGEPRMLWKSTRYTTQPEIAPDGKQVLFASNRDGTDGVYASALDGEPRRVLFGEKLRYLRPHWSADGRSIYAVRTATAGAPGQDAVRVAIEGGTPEVLTALGRGVIDVREGGDGNLYWAELAGHAMRLSRAPLKDLARSERVPVPLVSQYHIAAGRLAFVQPQLPAVTVCKLETMACEPVGLELSANEVYHWMLGARAIYYRVASGGVMRLVRFDLATRRITQRWDLAPSGAGTSIAMSPDEKTLMLAREEGPAIDLMIARP